MRKDSGGVEECSKVTVYDNRVGTACGLCD